MSRVVFFLLVVVCVYGRPSSVLLDVPYHRQFTDFACGDASLEMVLDFYGKVNLNQIFPIGNN